MEVNYNISQGRGEVDLLPAALGAKISLYLQPKQPIQFNIVDHPVRGNFGIGAGAGSDIAAGFKLGLDVKFDPGGKIDLTPKGSVGFGGFSQFAPSVTLSEWSNAPSG